jgi:hypothetical protein
MSVRVLFAARTADGENSLRSRSVREFTAVGAVTDGNVDKLRAKCGRSDRTNELISGVEMINFAVGTFRQRFNVSSCRCRYHHHQHRLGS